MIEDTQIKEGNYKLACFDSSLPQIVRKDCRRNRKDELKGIWKYETMLRKRTFGTSMAM
ncbi:hypothetical protein Gogos_021599 [Gossypium gossypioides]|nr:hypothetical protein [Gossypium gossypioides]